MIRFKPMMETILLIQKAKSRLLLANWLPLWNMS